MGRDPGAASSGARRAWAAAWLGAVAWAPAARVAGQPPAQRGVKPGSAPTTAWWRR